MLTKFKTAKRVVFLDPHSEKKIDVASTQKIDVILSPSLYWVKKLNLPVKYLRDAKKLLPSLFEDNLPAGNYSYAVFKEGESFIAFAYEDKKIIEELKKREINIALVQNVHFAQTELESSTPCKINDQEVMISENGVVFIAPLSWVEDPKPLLLQDLKLSNKTIALQQFSHIIDRGSIYKIAALLVVFIVVLGVEIFITTQKIASVEEQKDEVFSKYKLYPTMMQNRSVLEEYKGRYATQSTLRDLMEDILKLKLSSVQKVTQIELKNKVCHVTIEGVDEKTQKQILSQLSKYKTLSSKLTQQKLKVEVKL